MQKNKIIKKYSLWGAAIAFLFTNIIWVGVLFISNHSMNVNKNQIYQEQIDRLSYIASLSAEMSIIRKEDNKKSIFDPILQEIINQITMNVIINSIYEFDGESLVQFDILNGVFKKLIEERLIDPAILINPLGITEDSQYHHTKIIHDFYALDDNKVKKAMTLDEYKEFQKWFYNKIMKQVKKD